MSDQVIIAKYEQYPNYPYHLPDDDLILIT